MSDASPRIEPEFGQTDRLSQVQVESVDVLDPQYEQEQQVALYDLTEENRFRQVDPPLCGPYQMQVMAEERRFQFCLTSDAGKAEFSLPLSAMRRVMSAYTEACDSYFDAVKSLAPSQIEKIDEERRALHLEGAAHLAERLAPNALVDAHTARRLFTLLCALKPVR
ncbi:MAG: UPF0262 family protein [Neomegalonema sp.]|nr:UPF0262 family protein [Neomegalonema sp.]